MNTNTLGRILVFALLAALLSVAPQSASAQTTPSDNPSEGSEGPDVAGPTDLVDNALTSAIERYLVSFRGSSWGQAEPARSESGDGYGSSIAMGDFNADGRVDMAVGSPGEDLGSRTDAGSVLVSWAAAAHPITSPVLASFVAEEHQVLSQWKALPGRAESGDGFGTTLVAADFDGDGISDLAVGVPGEDLGSRVDAGAVTIFFGSGSGLRERTPLMLTESRTGVYLSEGGDRFGASLAAGDFDGDGAAELVVGGPTDKVLDQANAGMVSIFDIAADGELAGGDQMYQGGGSLGVVPGEPGVDDMFGAALATTDINGDGFADLVVGAPGQKVMGTAGSGSITTLLGSPDGLTAASARRLVNPVPEINAGFGSALAPDPIETHRVAVGAPGQSANGVVLAGAVFAMDLAAGRSLSVLSQHEGPGHPEEGDNFGSVLVMADLDIDGASELIVGVPDEGISSADVGAINIFWGTAFGPSPTQGFYHHQQGPGFGKNEAGDRFGASLAIADHGNNGLPNLTVGSPGEGYQNRGDVAAGTSHGVVSSTMNIAWLWNEVAFSERINPAGGLRDVTIYHHALPPVGPIEIRLCDTDLPESYSEIQALSGEEIASQCPVVLDTVEGGEPDFYHAGAQPGHTYGSLELTLPRDMRDGDFLLMYASGGEVAHLLELRYERLEVHTLGEHRLGVQTVAVAGYGFVPNGQVELRSCDRQSYGVAFEEICPGESIYVQADASGELLTSIEMNLANYNTQTVGVRDELGRIGFAPVYMIEPRVQPDKYSVPEPGAWSQTLTGQYFEPDQPTWILICSHGRETEEFRPEYIDCNPTRILDVPVQADGNFDFTFDIDVPEAGIAMWVVVGDIDAPVYLRSTGLRVQPPRLHAYADWTNELDIEIRFESAGWVPGDQVTLYECPSASMELPLEQHLGTCLVDPIATFVAGQSDNTEVAGSAAFDHQARPGNAAGTLNEHCVAVPEQHFLAMAFSSRARRSAVTRSHVFTARSRPPTWRHCRFSQLVAMAGCLPGHTWMHPDPPSAPMRRPNLAHRSWRFEAPAGATTLQCGCVTKAQRVMPPPVPRCSP